MKDLKRFGENNDNTPANPILKRILMVTVIILIGSGIAVYMVKTRPRAHKAPPKVQAPLVECVTVEKASHTIIIPVMGTVIPSASISLKSKVGGEVIHTSKEFIPGGRFTTGQVILKIDSRDYDLDVQKKESLLNVAKANLDLELGRQEVAREELDLMQKSSGREILDKALALRKPQLDQARAEYDSALADLESARLDRERTIIKAPFNCMILSRNIHKGAQVSALEGLAVIVNTDTYWIEATVPVDQLAWLTVPKGSKYPGSSARILAPGIEHPFPGEVIRISGQLNDQSRLANILIQVEDPLGLKSDSSPTPLMLNDYVRAMIQGKTLDDVIELPRALLRDHNQVWVFTNGKLEMRTVGIVWRDASHVYIKEGLDNQGCIIRSNLSGAVDGMDLRSTDDKPNTQPEIPEKQTP